ncbi:MAG: ABC transporter substrate-binding protein [Nitrospinae bacterium]|nr:ABC transporter substrate-binding protein [Nitrospinota bacterium]
MSAKNLWVRFVPAILAAAVLVCSVPSLSSASQITDNLKATIDKVLDIVTDEKYKTDKKTRRKLLREIIDAQFSYEQMGMRSLAQDWNPRTPEERKQFVDLFGKLLENSYATKIESYRDEKINYVAEEVRDGYAMVKTEIARKSDTIGVDYKLININGQWRVYDFIIEGVSMIRNYRSQFSKIIHKESYEGLVKKMTAKIEELESGNDKTKTDQL